MGDNPQSQPSRADVSTIRDALVKVLDTVDIEAIRRQIDPLASDAPTICNSHCKSLQLFRNLDTYGNPVDLVAEITPPDRCAENDAQAAVREKVD
jgi:hypothetical protein